MLKIIVASHNMKNFLSKYKLYILIGVALGVLLAGIWWLFMRNRNEGTTQSVVLPITAPFSDTISVKYSGTASDLNISSNMDVYKTTKIDESLAQTFIKNFYAGTASVSDDNSVYSWTFGDTIATYSLDTALLYVSSTSGLSSNLKINSAADIQSFLNQYFAIKDVQVNAAQSLGNGKVEYKGYMLNNGAQYGSLYIQGYAFDVIADVNKLYVLNVLLLKSENIVEYQLMPTIALSSLIADKTTPVYIDYLSFDDNFQDQFPLIQASAKLKTFTIKSQAYKYIFDSFTYGYVLPVYEVKGDGSLMDSQGNSYWADTLIYICALDPQYLEAASSNKLDIAQ